MNSVSMGSEARDSSKDDVPGAAAKGPEKEGINSESKSAPTELEKTGNLAQTTSSNSLKEKREVKEDSESPGVVLENAAGPAASFASQEHAKMLERLRDELVTLRKTNNQLNEDNLNLKESNRKLMEAHKSAGNTFAGFVEHSKKLNEVNEKLTAENEELSKQISNLKLAQEELKEEVKMKNATYVAEVHSRIELQETLLEVVDAIRSRCRDKGLVGDILEMTGTDDLQE